ncbi:MAG TPA: hypothetical protein H9754_01505 [Candidatus Anaerostipes avistercoris]|uniref:Uncharacterized protein n=1 Tax=Candidatus Anaerostipes avistercoris TaxID=2838462 RepID=A0A9D2PG02_9FIRM|nr:hypothetical protein [Candidatus Anaerostipes avistercoris]
MEKFDDNKLFQFVYVSAMRDAVLQKAYEGEKKWLTTEETLEARNKVKEYIDYILEVGFKNQEEHDKKFIETASGVCDVINKKIETNGRNGQFTFGNAQKLINIVCKYFYIISYKDSYVREKFKYCHCPMDSILLENVWSKKKDEIKEQSNMNVNDFKSSWGKENWKINDKENYEVPDRYSIFQDNVRALAQNEGIFPIEYDYKIWGENLEK